MNKYQIGDLFIRKEHIGAEETHLVIKLIDIKNDKSFSFEVLDDDLYPDEIGLKFDDINVEYLEKNFNRYRRINKIWCDLNV